MIFSVAHRTQMIRLTMCGTEAAFRLFSKARAAILRLNAAQRSTMTASREHRNEDANGNMPAESMMERVERALLLLAYFIELDGDVHLPMYERFEAELAELKAMADAKTRASQRLETYRLSGERKAIISRNLSFSSSDGPFPYLGL
jgi:hypothetical protein